MSDFEIAPGAILTGRYRVESVVGRGGMGVVFAARHLTLGERVAVKVLAGPASENREALARFQREARILARVRNDHIVRVIDLGQLENGAPFIVMEHLEGRDLGSWLEDQGRFAAETAVAVVLQALVALAAAHAAGVVHRDLKPENLFCVACEDGALLIKVLDFGISRLERPIDDELFQSSVTRTDSTVGTPLYMSPEQLRNAKGVDARSDIWSIGVVLYELLTGVPPFTGASFGDVAINIATNPPRALDGVEPPLDPGVVSVVSLCLEKEREHRFQNVAELSRALSRFGPPGSERIAERIERILLRSPPERTEIEQAGFSALEAAVSPDSTRAQPTSNAEVVSSATSFRQQRGRSSRLGILIPAFALAACGLAWRLLGVRTVDATKTVLAVSVLPERPVPGPAAVASRPELSVLPAAALPPPSAEPISAPDAPRAPRPARAPSSDLMKSGSGHRPPRTAAAQPSCNPPYTVDAQGRKKFRHECFIESQPP